MGNYNIGGNYSGCCIIKYFCRYLHTHNTLFSYTDDAQYECAADAIDLCCNEQQPKTKYQFTPKDNAILFLIVIFLVLLLSGNASDRGYGCGVGWY